MSKDVIAACQMFLVPASILFVAIGAAETEPLKALLSLIGVGLSAFWLIIGFGWDDSNKPADQKLCYFDRTAMVGLAATFWIASFISTGVHIARWVDVIQESN
jgi:peptidoglycan/LPS O-acetylase OafA/YrhL